MPSLKNYIGIDPGKSGGWACIERGNIVSLHRMPDTLPDLLIELEKGPTGVNTVCVIEKVQSTPRMGHSAAFTFGKGYGALLMALAALEIPFEEVHPQKWMKFYSMKKGKGESSSQWKTRLWEKARNLYPAITIPKDLADAMLLANYCRRNY